MIKRDSFKILSLIATAYPIRNTEITQEKIDTYHETLVDHDFHDVQRMLKRYINENKYPPTLADIIPPKKEISSQVYSNEQRKWQRDAADLSEVASILEKTKNLLRGGTA